MELSSANISKALTHFLHRFHIIIFVLVVLGSLVAVVFLLNNIIIKSSDSSNYTSPGADTSFDQDTINRLSQLRTRDQTPAPLDLSKGRTNPFIE